MPSDKAQTSKRSLFPCTFGLRANLRVSAVWTALFLLNVFVLTHNVQRELQRSSLVIPLLLLRLCCSGARVNASKRSDCRDQCCVEAPLLGQAWSCARPPARKMETGGGVSEIRTRSGARGKAKVLPKSGHQPFVLSQNHPQSERQSQTTMSTESRHAYRTRVHLLYLHIANNGLGSSLINRAARSTSGIWEFGRITMV